MATKRVAKSTSKSTAGSRRKPTAARKSGKGVQAAVPPPDNPLLRHALLKVDLAPPGAPAATAASLSAAVAAAVSPSAMAPGEATGKKGKRMEAAQSAATAAFRIRAMKHTSASAGTQLATAFGLEAEPTAPTVGVSNWVQMGPVAIPNGQTYSGARVLVSGRVTAIVVDPTDSNIIYVGTAQGGVWKTIDGGTTWTPQNDNNISMAIGALAMDPANHLVLYAGTGEGNFSGDSYYGSGILATTDGGATPWAELATSTFLGVRFSRLAVMPGTPAKLFGATGNGLFRSTDSGVTWNVMSGLPAAAATDVAIDPATPATVYAAFWANGIYKSTNAGAANPTWTKLAGGLPASGLSRIAISISPSSPSTLYALIANTAYNVNQFYVSTDAGVTWSAIALPGGNIGGQGFYNLNVAVDPTTPDIVYLSGIELWKATRSGAAWTIVKIGGGFHPDNHALAFDPADHLVMYAGSDGGIYRSADGGTTWSDSINQGLCIAQFEFIAQHPTSDAVIFGGTQDNGTEQFRNDGVFYHADDGDGGFCLIDFNVPTNVLSTYYGPSPKRSTQGGKFGTWMTASTGITTGGLFYPPLAMDATNPSNLAIGTDRIYLDAAQGAGGWTTTVALPGLSGAVSAIDYVNGSLIYAASTTGQAYRLQKSGATWSAALISAPPLPNRFIWDISALPGAPGTVIVVMSGFGASHVWKGAVPASGAATWTDISGIGAGVLPDIPVNALVVDTATTYYIATDVAVFMTSNGGTTWTPFSDGLPNCAVFDLKLHGPTRLLRAATHGRGLWERKLDVAAMPATDLYVRDHLMDTGRATPSPSGIAAAFEDPLQHVALGSPLYYWMCADIKVDALEGTVPAYQMPVAAVDYVAYEAALQHRNAQRGRVNRVYVQVHNRGIQPGAGVKVRLYFADASAGLPPLPPNFWTAFPPSAGGWTAILPDKTISSLSNTIPTVLEWDWNTPATAADHSCLLVVVDSPADPIPAVNKIFNADLLVPLEKRVGLKNLHVVDASPAAPYASFLQFYRASTKAQSIRIRPSPAASGSVSLILPMSAAAEVQLHGIKLRKPTTAELAALRKKAGDTLGDYDLAKCFTLGSPREDGVLSWAKVARGTMKALLLITPAGSGSLQYSVIQEEIRKGVPTVIGGSTYVFRAKT